MPEDVKNLSKETWTNLIKTAICFSSEVCMNYENFVSNDFVNRLNANVIEF
jgi:hypothetical protein